MIAALLAEAWPYLAAAGVAVLALWRAYARGRRDAADRAAAERAAAYQETRERIDDEVLDSDVAAALQRLRDRSGK